MPLGIYIYIFIYIHLYVFYIYVHHLIEVVKFIEHITGIYVLIHTYMYICTRTYLAMLHMHTYIYARQIDFLPIDLSCRLVDSSPQKAIWKGAVWTHGIPCIGETHLGCWFFVQFIYQASQGWKLIWPLDVISSKEGSRIPPGEVRKIIESKVPLKGDMWWFPGG